MKSYKKPFETLLFNLDLYILFVNRLSISRQSTSVDAAQDGSGGSAEVTGSQRSIVAQVSNLLYSFQLYWSLKSVFNRYF